MQHLVVIHRRLLPVHAVRHDLHPHLHLKILHGKRDKLLCLLALRETHADLKQPVILNDAPVTHIAVSGMTFHDVFRLQDHAVIIFL